jgi:glucose/arabinose dehydrogenase
MFVTERDTDRVLVFASARRGAPLVGSLTLPDSEGFHAGPMGLTLHPHFARNGLVYVCVTRNAAQRGPRLMVVRLRVTGTRAATRLVEDRVILRGDRGSPVNSGCRLRFDSDGLLWIAVGQGARAASSSDPASLMGKVLRVDADGRPAAENPPVDGGTAPTPILSLGHRNPQGIDFAPGRGDAYVVEHGPDRDDEINRIEPGGDYGWPASSGSDGLGGVADPAWSSGRETIAPSGAAFVTGDTWGSWEGDLVVATLKDEDLRRYRLRDDGATLTQEEVLLDGRFGRLRAVTLGPDGSLYVTTSNSEYGAARDMVVRLEPRP